MPAKEQQRPTMIHYDFNGERHTMGRDEMEAIERSGPPHRVTDYAHPSAPNDWPVETFPVRPLMDARPGAVDPWVRPAEQVITKPRVDRPNQCKKSDGLFHYRVDSRSNPTCGAYANRADVMGFEPFRTITKHPKVCQECREHWLVEASRRNKLRVRGTIGFFRPKNWSPAQRKRLAEWRGKGSTLSRGGYKVEAKSN